MLRQRDAARCCCEVASQESTCLARCGRGAARERRKKRRKRRRTRRMDCTGRDAAPAQVNAAEDEGAATVMAGEIQNFDAFDAFDDADEKQGDQSKVHIACSKKAKVYYDCRVWPMI